MNRINVIDFIVRPHGTVWTFEPKTEEANKKPTPYQAKAISKAPKSVRI